MDEKTLRQYVSLKKESEDLKRRIYRLKSEVNKMRNDGIISSDTNTYIEKQVLRAEYIDRLTELEQKLIKKTVEIENYISEIPDSFIRQIIRYKYVDGMSWERTARKMGGYNTRDSIRMTAKRFFHKNNIKKSC